MSLVNKLFGKHHHGLSSPSPSISSLDKAATNPSLVNLKQLVLAYAQSLYKSGDYSKHKWNELTKEINWSNFQVKHCQVRYTDIGEPSQPKSQVLFRSTFVNDTDNEQEYELNSERKTVSSCSFELFEGFVVEGEAEVSLSVPIPGCALEANAGFRSEYTLETVRCKNVQEEINWSVKSTIKVPSMTNTTAELMVRENEYKGNFEIKTYFRGDISVKLLHNGIEICEIELADLDDLLTREKGFQRDSKGLFRMTRGRCNARFGIDQKIELRQRPI